MLGWFSDEPLGVSFIGEVQDGLPSRNELHRLAIVDRCRSEQLQTRMMVLLVIPREEILAEPACILDGAETVRVIWPILHSLEVGFRERVVIGNMWAAVRSDHTEIRE